MNEFDSRIAPHQLITFLVHPIKDVFCTLTGVSSQEPVFACLLKFAFAPKCEIVFAKELRIFNQQEYINTFIKENYKTSKIRIRRDDRLLMSQISKVDNINKYIVSLILEDVYRNRTYHYINDDIEIDFELSKPMRHLVEEAEKADILEDYGLYMNIADAIESQGKKETTHHVLRETPWKKLIRRYCL